MKTFTLMFMLLGFAALAAGEVVKSFETSCPDFFIRDPRDENKPITPTIFEGEQYKQICQRWKNKYRFATLFDTKRRIPVYSALTYYDSEVKVERKGIWKNEPQLEDPNSNNKDMKVMKKVLFNQAMTKDYKNTSYTRGHVFPNSYAVDQDQADSSFTMTNIAPQTESNNRNWERFVEKPMLKQIKRMCNTSVDHPVYIVTGVVPGEKWIAMRRNGIDIKDGVNVPSHYWTAYTYIKDGLTISRAYLARQEIQDQNIPFESKSMTVKQLKTELGKLYKKPFTIFSRKKQQHSKCLTC